MYVHINHISGMSRGGILYGQAHCGDESVSTPDQLFAKTPNAVGAVQARVVLSKAN